MNEMTRIAIDTSESVFTVHGTDANGRAMLRRNPRRHDMVPVFARRLPTGTRCGALDLGVVLFLIQDRGYDGKAIETLLYKQSGLFGVSGVSNDTGDLMASRARHAADAIDLFVYQITRYVGSLAAALGRIHTGAVLGAAA